MKVSELIAELNKFLNEHGDYDVVAYDRNEESNSFVNIINYSENPSKNYYFKGDSVTEDKSCVLECYGGKLISLKDRLKELKTDENTTCKVSICKKNGNFFRKTCKLNELIENNYENYLTNWFDFNSKNNALTTWLIEK